MLSVVLLYLGDIMLPALIVIMFNVIFNECHYVECNYAWYHLLSIVMLSVIPLNAIYAVSVRANLNRYYQPWAQSYEAFSV
jgi:hypothetical protein